MEENVILINGRIMINVDVSVKNVMYVKNITFGILLHVSGKYLSSIMNDLAITCDEVIETYDEETKTAPTNFNKKKAIWETQNFYISLAFY